MIPCSTFESIYSQGLSLCESSSEKVIFNKSSDNKIKGKVENIFFLGSHYEVFVKVNDEIVKINVSDKHLLEKEITFFLDKKDLKILED